VWSEKPILYVDHLELRKHFSSDLVRNRISPVLVLNDLEFKKLVNQAQMKQEKEKKISQLEQKQIDLYHRARLFEEIANGRIPGFVPHPGEPKISWLPLEAFMNEEGLEIAGNLYPRPELDQAASSFGLLVDLLKNEHADEALLAGKRFSKSLEGLLLSRDMVLDKTAMDREFIYLKLRPFHLAWILYLISLFIWLAPKKTKKVTFAALSIFVSGFAVHTFGFILRILIAGRPPVTNMYESIIWVAWAAALFSLIFWLFYRSELLPAIAACVATIGLLIAENFPALLDPSIAPLVPVLRSNYWLTIHVLTITLGYGAFLFNWGIAHALLYSFAFHKKKETADHLAVYLYRSLQIGIILLASGTILGGVWAAESWGRFWGWDPKETWALIAVLAYLAVLHSRTAGWLNAFGVAFWCAISFLTVLMAWYGVNFVLGAGLHSYGFGSSSGLLYVFGFVLTDVFMILWLAKRFK
jgi:cytochrome c-type biogenesis protein CcsB